MGAIALIEVIIGMVFVVLLTSIIVSLINEILVTNLKIRSKLLKIKVFGEDLEYVITELIKADFLNEQRYAETYAGGKFRIKKWGKQKIKNSTER